MAKKYEVGGKYYLPVTVSDVVNTFIRMKYLDGVNNYHLMINDMPDLLLTAEEVYAGNTVPLIADAATLKSENERLSKQNEELGVKVDGLKAELENARSLNEFAVKAEQNMTKQVAELRGLIKKYGMVIDILADKIASLKKGENDG